MAEKKSVALIDVGCDVLKALTLFLEKYINVYGCLPSHYGSDSLQGRFGATFKFPYHSTVSFFGRGGDMRALDIPDDLWKEMLVYRPNV